MQQRAEHQQPGRRRPEEIQRKQVEVSGEPTHQRALQPLARQGGRCGAAQYGDEFYQRPEPFGSGQLLGSHEPEQDHDARAGEHGDDRQNVPRAPSRKDVHQQQREGAADDRRNNQKRKKGGDRDERKPDATVKREAIRREHRNGEQDHHPTGMQRCFKQFGAVDGEPVHRRRHQQVEIAGEEERRQRRDDVRQQQNGDEREQEHAQ